MDLDALPNSRMIIEDIYLADSATTHYFTSYSKNYFVNLKMSKAEAVYDLPTIISRRKLMTTGMQTLGGLRSPNHNFMYIHKNRPCPYEFT